MISKILLNMTFFTLTAFIVNKNKGEVKDLVQIKCQEVIHLILIYYILLQKLVKVQ